MPGDWSLIFNMVYYFKSTVVDPPAFIYVGKDKVESEYSPTLLCSTDNLSQMRISLNLDGTKMCGTSNRISST